LNAKNQKEVQTKLTKNLLDMIILQRLEQKSMHGYQLIVTIKKDFGVYFGPSTVYPLLGLLEKKKLVSSAWDMSNERPRKVFSLTQEGKASLAFTENSLVMLCQKVNQDTKVQFHVATPVLTA
jgi:DNA-binding PadR family transcriptional regulator